MRPLAEQLDATLMAAAWGRARRSPGPGIDGVHGGRFAVDLDARLEGLRADLLNGTYRPSALLRRTRPKPDGTERVLGVPTLRDRVAQDAVLIAASELDGRLAPQVHGYRPGRSPATAVRDLLRQIGTREHLEIVQADISGLFDHLEHDRLRAALRQAWENPLWLRLNEGWLTAWPTSPGHGIPQGAPLSPLLANLYLTLHLDVQLQAGPADTLGAHLHVSPSARLASARWTLHGALFHRPAPARGDPELCAWIRYGDDLVLASARPGGGVALLRRLDAAVRSAGLELGDHKTTTAASRAGMPLPRKVLGEILLFQRSSSGWTLCPAGTPRLSATSPWERTR